MKKMKQYKLFAAAFAVLALASCNYCIIRSIPTQYFLLN